jgi:hypothetical protein
MCRVLLGKLSLGYTLVREKLKLVSLAVELEVARSFRPGVGRGGLSPAEEVEGIVKKGGGKIFSRYCPVLAVTWSDFVFLKALMPNPPLHGRRKVCGRERGVILLLCCSAVPFACPTVAPSHCRPVAPSRCRTAVLSPCL